MVKEYDVAAVVVIQRKFCNPHEWDNPRLFKFLKGLNLPYTMIELDTTYMNNEIQSKVQGLIDIVRG
jgi:benzoyl-CoA reductase/2-hydroxyglutaryl-CoA dehydratase subunit BcrC/BadD/HgdB